MLLHSCTVILVAMAATVQAETKCGSAGTEFMLGLFASFNGDAGRPYIYVVTAEPTNVTVSIPYYPVKKTFQLSRKVRLNLNNLILGTGDDELSNKGVEIMSEKPIRVFAYFDSRYEGEGTLILPAECASTEYLVVTHTASSWDEYKGHVMIIGLTNNTEVTLAFRSGDTKTVNLDRYGSYSYKDVDLTGAVVTANASVVTLSGHMCANVPTADTQYCDYIIEQMPPMSSLKTVHILSYMYPRPTFSVRVVAAHDDTNVTIRNTSGATISATSLNKGESYFTSYDSHDTISITSNKGVLIAQYGQGLAVDPWGFGNPSMVVVPGIDQFEPEYHIYADRRRFEFHYVTVVISSEFNITGLRMNGKSFNTENSITIFVPGYGDFKVLNLRSKHTVVSLSHTDRAATFSALQYGYRWLKGYALMAGRVV